MKLAPVAGLAAVAMLVAACGSSSSSGKSGSGGSTQLTASAPGITASTITLGSHQPLTGIAAPGYDEIAPASNAYFQYLNAHGGIYGRKIVYKYLNDQYNPVDDRRAWSASWCSRTTSTRSSTAWARPPTWPWRRS